MSATIEINILDVVMIVISLLILVLYVLNSIKLTKLRKNYSTFMTKIGKGENVYDMMQKYIQEVERISAENGEIEKYCEKIEDISKDNLKNIGLVRYNAYKDTGSDLSFALAILNDKNTGIVLNGIYGRDTSNIYAKPISEGKSTYALSKEEEQALNKAISNK